jgi:hypothetical protein
LCPVYYKGPEIIAKAAASLYNEDHRENMFIFMMFRIIQINHVDK